MTRTRVLAALLAGLTAPTGAGGGTGGAQRPPLRTELAVLRSRTVLGVIAVTVLVNGAFGNAQDQIADAILVFVGGLLLTFPGFVSDVVGLVFVLPFTRPIARIGLEAVVARKLLAVGLDVAPGEARVRRTRDHDGDVVEGEIVDD